jgi:hypothetical protein
MGGPGDAARIDAPSATTALGAPISTPSAASPDDGPAPGTLTDLAEPTNRFDRILQAVPRLLSSKTHVILLIALGVYLVVLPLVGVVVSAKAELIGGNYTNVTSDVGACIAAGGTLHLVKQARRRHRIEDERLRLTREMHALLGRAHPELAAQLGLASGGGAPAVPAPAGDPSPGATPGGGAAPVAGDEPR